MSYFVVRIIVMRIKSCIFYLFFLLLFIGCKSDKAKPLKMFADIASEQIERDVQNMKVVDSSATTIIEEDCTLKKELRLSSWVDSISYLRLDSRDAALIGAVNKFGERTKLFICWIGTRPNLLRSFRQMGRS